MFTVWHLCLVVLLPLLAVGTHQRHTRLCAWAIVLGASVATWIYQALGLHDFLNSVAFYCLLDIVAAWFILHGDRTGWHRALGATFLFMAFSNIGFLIVDQLALKNLLSARPDPVQLVTVLTAIGWSQPLLLLSWGLRDLLPDLAVHCGRGDSVEAPASNRLDGRED